LNEVPLADDRDEIEFEAENGSSETARNTDDIEKDQLLPYSPLIITSFKEDEENVNKE